MDRVLLSFVRAFVLAVVCLGATAQASSLDRGL